MTFDEGLSQDTREKPSIAAGIMPTVGEKNFPAPSTGIAMRKKRRRVRG